MESGISYKTLSARIRTLDRNMYMLRVDLEELVKRVEAQEDLSRKTQQLLRLIKTQMAVMQYLVNQIAPNDKKLPPDWLNQLEMVRDIVNPQKNGTETDTTTEADS